MDDSRPVGERLAALLQCIEGVELLPQVFDAAQAWRVFQSDCPAVVLLDLHLSDGTCLGLLRDIKAKSPSTRVIVLTAHADNRYRRPCFDAGADFYFSKATDLPRLVAILTDLAVIRGLGK